MVDFAQIAEGPVYISICIFFTKNTYYTSMCIIYAFRYITSIHTKCSIIVINENWLILQQLCIVHTNHHETKAGLFK